MLFIIQINLKLTKSLEILMSNELPHIEGFIFDLDNCFYPERADASSDFSKASKLTLVDAYPELNGENLEDATKQSFREHGNDIAAFAAEYDYPNGRPYMELYQSFHRYALPLVKDMFVPQQGLIESLTLLKEKTRFVVLTHAPMEWAMTAIETMGLDHLLPPEDVYSQDHPDIDGMRKDLHEEPFNIALNHLGTRAENTAFLDDSNKNHIVANSMGLHTVHVQWEQTTMQHAYVRDNSLGPVPFLRRVLQI